MDNRSIEEILEEMLDKISNTEDKSENSFVHDVLAPAAIEMFGLNRQVENVYGKFDNENIEGEELDIFTYSRTGLERQQATYATTEVVISGGVGTVIEEGVLVSTGELDYRVIESATIGSNGNATVTVEAVEAGSIGNVPADSITEFPTTVPGLIGVYNPYSVVNGVDIETDESYRGRYYKKLQSPGKAGNVFHYQEWAESVPGVGRVRVFPLWDGPLTVKVLIIDTDMRASNGDLVADVSEYIEQERPFGAYVTVDTPAEVEIDVSVKVVKDEGLDIQILNNRVKENLDEYFRMIAFKGDYISLARIGNVILDTEGVYDFDELRINGLDKNIEIEVDNIAITGKVDVINMEKEWFDE